MDMICIRQRDKAWLERDCRMATGSVKRGAGKNDRSIRSKRGKGGAVRGKECAWCKYGETGHVIALCGKVKPKSG